MPTPIVVAIVCILITSLVLRKTALGLYIQSVGINKKASRIAGINSERIIFLCYVVCGLCAGIAGIVASTPGSALRFQQHRTELRAGCDSGSCTRRQQPRRRKVPAGRLYYRCVHHQAITTTRMRSASRPSRHRCTRRSLLSLLWQSRHLRLRHFMKKMSVRRQLCQRRCCIMKAKN